jgi:formylglycine-generating enzyme required for sulfatase activity
MKNLTEMRSILLILGMALCINAVSQKPEAEMVLIPSGEFNMGRNSGTPSDWQPEHKVRVSSFYMDKYEVTNQKYYDFCIATKSALPQFWGFKEYKSGLDFPDYPVVGVSFFDAEKYASWSGKRLPTEAEWEFAARGGLINKNYPDGDQTDSTKVNYGRKYKGILAVGYFKPNGYGLYDITGNVWEWTSDFYGDDYYAASPVENPKGPERGRFKVIRGGSWHSGAMCVQTFYRNGLSPGWVDFAVGFRCVKDIK